MLAGKRAFAGESAASVIAAILEREPAPLTAAPPLGRVVRRALAKDPDQRFQTARDLKAALQWAIEQPPPAPAAKRSRLWRWIAAAALMIGALGGWEVGHLGRGPAKTQVIRFLIDPPQDGQFVLGNTVGGIALSPDGRTLAFVAAAGGKTMLWARTLDSAEAADWRNGRRRLPLLVPGQQIDRLLPGKESAAGGFGRRVAAHDLPGASLGGPRRRLGRQRTHPVRIVRVGPVPGRGIRRKPSARDEA
jgi:hypothetical protein